MRKGAIALFALALGVTASAVPAKIFVPLTVKQRTNVLVKPVFTAVQLLPLLVDKKAPPPAAPAKIFVPLTASD